MTFSSNLTGDKMILLCKFSRISKCYRINRIDQISDSEASHFVRVVEAQKIIKYPLIYICFFHNKSMGKHFLACMTSREGLVSCNSHLASKPGKIL